jgi:hypothetical protein
MYARTSALSAGICLSLCAGIALIGYGGGGGPAPPNFSLSATLTTVNVSPSVSFFHRRDGKRVQHYDPGSAAGTNDNIHVPDEHPFQGRLFTSKRLICPFVGTAWQQAAWLCPVF